VVYDVEKVIRAEDDLANLVVQNSTFGHGVYWGFIEYAGGSAGTPTWVLRNNAWVNRKPAIATDPSNIVAVAADFVDSTARDYHLIAGSSLIDVATPSGAVTTDHDGTPRPAGAGYDVGAYEFVPTALAPSPAAPSPLASLAALPEALSPFAQKVTRRLISSRAMAVDAALAEDGADGGDAAVPLVARRQRRSAAEA
jgi:hypothetical protein